MKVTDAAAAIAELETAVAPAARAKRPEPAMQAMLASVPAIRVFPVNEWGDVAITRHQARRLAREHGVEPRRAGEVAIVVSELASNIVKYAVCGEIVLCVTSMAGAAGGGGGAGAAGVGGAGGGGMVLTVQARDSGPPIHDLATAMLDGHDDRGPIDPAKMAQRGGLGTGLGAVARLADSVEVRQEASGKQITATFSRGLPRGF